MTTASTVKKPCPTSRCNPGDSTRALVYPHYQYTFSRRKSQSRVEEWGGKRTERCHNLNPFQMMDMLQTLALHSASSRTGQQQQQKSVGRNKENKYENFISHPHCSAPSTFTWWNKGYRLSIQLQHSMPKSQPEKPWLQGAQSGALFLWLQFVTLRTYKWVVIGIALFSHWNSRWLDHSYPISFFVQPGSTAYWLFNIFINIIFMRQLDRRHIRT